MKANQKQQWSKKSDFKFSAGPWNLHAGADPFGPPVRPEREFAAKAQAYKDLGLRLRPVPRRRHRARTAPRRPSARRRPRRSRSCSTTRACSPRSSPRGSGKSPRRRRAGHQRTTPPTASAPSSGKRDDRRRPHPRHDRFVWWLAREGTYIREAKDAVRAPRLHARVIERDARARQEHPHPRRDEAQRADGPGVPADGRPLPGARATRAATRRASAC